MRSAATMVVVTCAVAMLAGCTAGSGAEAGIAVAELPVEPSVQAAVVVTESPSPVPTADDASDEASADASEDAAVATGAEQTASIHRGPVRASIEATRDSDGALLSVTVDLPRAFADDPLVTVDCSLDSDAGGLAVVIQDLAIQEGIATATLVIPEPVTRAGSYDGVLALLGADGESVRAPGKFRVGDSLDAGRFDVTDLATGEAYSGAWECRSV